MRELLPLDHPTARRALAHVREAAMARRDPATRILHIVWDAEDEYPEHAWGNEQWSVRPYRVGQGCDGTIEDNMHAVAIALLAQLGLDYRALYGEAYPDRTLSGWPTPERAASLAAETTLPELNIETLSLLLYDIYDTNHRTLHEMLEERLEALGFPADRLSILASRLRLVASHHGREPTPAAAAPHPAGEPGEAR